MSTAILGNIQPMMGRLLSVFLTWTSISMAILWGASYLAFTLRAIHQEHPEDLLRQNRKGAIFLMGALGFTFLLLFLLHQEVLITMISKGISSLVFLAVTILSLGLLYSAHRKEEEVSQRKLRVLGVAYSVFFVTVTALVWWNRFSPLLPRYTFITLNVGLEIIYNLLTVFWIHFFDLPLPTQTSTALDPVPVLNAERTFLDNFGISKREQEVIQLICRGQTNQEIADALFISLKTVKDHNYRIFQKTGVRNRVELVQLAQGTTQTEQAG
jgi:DNA-binding CsgD family transcriptional regulator